MCICRWVAVILQLPKTFSGYTEKSREKEDENGKRMMGGCRALKEIRMGS